MVQYNNLLKRQMKKCNLTLRQEEELLKLLEIVNETYLHFEEEMVLLERSIEISSREYNERIEDSKALQAQLIQNEKMACIGQLSAGIAHEINNPLGYVQSNMGTLKNYTNKIQDMYEFTKKMLEKQENINEGIFKEDCSKLKDFIKKNKIEFIFDDLFELVNESVNGLLRIEKIVKGLLNFSRKNDEGEMTMYDLNKGIKDTVIIANNEVKYHAQVVEEYGDIPTVKAFADEINQVILNLIVNAVHAIKSKDIHGTINIRTYCDEKMIYCDISDNGTGISEENLEKIFEAFFTTKPIGTGTGLGLSIAYDIINGKHKGILDVNSVLGEGTTFTMGLPIN
jgi:two-component system, NtrC family, sensor kinase